MPSKIQHPNSYGTAKRLRQNFESVPDAILIFPNTIVMTTVVCEDCGARFALVHRPAFQDGGLAKRQAVWLKDQFVWDHIQENKHSGSIRLPGSHELKAVGEGKGSWARW